MGALTVSDLTLMANEPCVRDVRLGEALGYDRVSRVRDLIGRHHDELLAHGSLPQVAAMITLGKGGQRHVSEYYLNEAQALLVCMFARTEKAAAIRKQVIEVFLAWRRGELVNADVAPDRTVEILQRLEARLSALESAGLQMQSVAEDPGPTVLALTHARELWTAGHRPRWWHDLEVRNLALTTHRQMSLDRAKGLIVDKLGAGRAPSRSSLHRFWCQLDRLKYAHHSLRKH